MKNLSFIILLAFFFSSCQKEKTIFIADHYGDCETECLLVRENENDDWIPFSENIEGFDYQEGYSYKLNVNIKKEKSVLKYTLINIISKDKTKTDPIEEDKWLVTKIQGFDNTTNKTPFFTINNGVIKGNSGCNQFSAPIVFNTTATFNVATLRQTKMYCQEYMSLENAFLTALHNASHYKLLKGKLFVVDSEGKPLFIASKKQIINELQKKWFISSIKGYHNKTGKMPFFTIGKGVINGNNGCNDFGGELATDNSDLFKVTELRQTEMYCNKFASLETAFSTNLSKVTHYKITEGALLLFDKSNYVLMTASSKKPILESGVMYQLPYIIEYNAYSKVFSITNKIIEIKNIMEYSDLFPKKTKEKTITLSKSDLKFFKDEILKIGVASLETIQPPSLKHQHDGSPSASLVIIFKGKTYTVPTFDHENPPKKVKAIVEKIMALRSEEN